jgi:hypothetical protein
MKNVGVMTSTSIVVVLLTLPGLAVPFTSILYSPGVVAGVVALVAIVSVEVAVPPRFNGSDAGLNVTIGKVGFGRTLEILSVSVTVVLGRL